MEKQEVIVDTCFLNKITNEGKNPDNVKRILNELKYMPVVHPYLAKHELSMFSYFEKMVNEGYIKVIDYKTFLPDSFSKKTYESYFALIYEDLRQYLEACGRPKIDLMKPLLLRNNQTIYDIRNQGSSYGDVHTILMASYMQLPVILTEDSDIGVLRAIVSKRLSMGAYSVKIYNALDLIKIIASNPESKIDKQELENILNEMHERSHRSEIKQIYNDTHK